jgi:hypothetical protein
LDAAVPLWQRGVALLLWALVGVAKTIALLLLLTDADARWPDALLLLVAAWALVGVALLWRSRAA